MSTIKNITKKFSDQPALVIAEEVLKDRNWQPDPEPLKAFRNLSFSIVNASQSSDKYSLHYDGAGTKMFSGKFWSDPIDTVKPEKSVNFQTCTIEI